MFKLDHLATRVRRHGENLLAFAGAEPGRRWSQAGPAARRAARWRRWGRAVWAVTPRDLPDVNVLSRVVNDLAHLLAELLENATSYSRPRPRAW